MAKAIAGWLGFGGGKARALALAAQKPDGEFEFLLASAEGWPQELLAWTESGRELWRSALRAGPARSMALARSLEGRGLEGAQALDPMAGLAAQAGDRETYGLLAGMGARPEWDNEALRVAIWEARGCFMLGEALARAPQWSHRKSLAMLLDWALSADNEQAALMLMDRLGPACLDLPPAAGGETLMLRAARKNSMALCARLLSFGGHPRQPNAMGIDALAYSRRAFADCALYAMFVEHERRLRADPEAARDYLDGVVAASGACSGGGQSLGQGAGARQAGAEREGETSENGERRRETPGASVAGPLPWAARLAAPGDERSLERACDALAALESLLGFVPRKAGLLAFLEALSAKQARRAFEALEPVEEDEEDEVEFWGGEEAQRALAGLRYCALRLGLGKPAKPLRRAAEF